MTENLKSCPFCGGTAEIIEEGIGFNIKCADCYAEITPFATDKRDAIKMWNDRPIEDKLHEEIEKLKAENERLRKALEHVVTTDTTVDKWGIWRIDGKTFQTWAADVLKGNEND